MVKNKEFSPLNTPPADWKDRRTWFREDADEEYDYDIGQNIHRIVLYLGVALIKYYDELKGDKELLPYCQHIGQATLSVLGVKEVG